MTTSLIHRIVFLRINYSKINLDKAVFTSNDFIKATIYVGHVFFAQIDGQVHGGIVECYAQTVAKNMQHVTTGVTKLVTGHCRLHELHRHVWTPFGHQGSHVFQVTREEVLHLWRWSAEHIFIVNQSWTVQFYHCQFPQRFIPLFSLFKIGLKNACKVPEVVRCVARRGGTEVNG